jgi:hypothetical protein
MRYIAPLGVVLSISLVHGAFAETRGYAVSWLAQAMNAQDGDCPGGVNPPWSEQRLKDLADLGYTPQQIQEMVKQELSGKREGTIDEIIAMRGRINGQPANPYTYPNTVIDPKLHSVVAKYGYGFNLDGKGAASPNGFEDPETHEKGVNNELARALGCMREFRGSLTVAPLYWEWTWGQLKETQPAWLVTITGEDLSKDGDVTVTFDRALEHLRHNSDGSARNDMTYRIDPDPRWHNAYRATIRNGQIVLKEPGATGIRLMQDPLVAMEFRLSKVHMRLRLKADRTLTAMVGGYQPWSDLYYSFAGGGAANESASTGDMPGIYYLFKKFADADPDPITGQNASISATYYMQAVPAFVVAAETSESGGH